MIQVAYWWLFKQVTNAQLRKGYRDDQSKKANLLIGYVNAHDGSWFLPPTINEV
jgi:hypothetical protein